MLLERGSSSQSNIIISLAVKPLAADDGEVHLEEAGLWLLLNSLPFSASLALEAAVAARSLSKLLVLPKESVDSQYSIINPSTRISASLSGIFQGRCAIHRML